MCVECGLEGKYFAKEKDDKAARYHFNLFAVNEDGNEVLMTKDHIYPKSKGGKDVLENFQTMCTHCNTRKGDKILEKA